MYFLCLAEPEQTKEISSPMGAQIAKHKHQNKVCFSRTNWIKMETPSEPMFASISLNQSDLLRLIRFPSTTVDTVRTAIKDAWSKGTELRTLATAVTQFASGIQHEELRGD